MRRYRACLACAFAIIASLFVALSLTGAVLGQSARATKLTVNAATDADKASFDALLEKCSRESKAFKDLLAAINASAKTVTVNVGRNQPGVVPDSFDGGGTGTIDLDDMEKFPNPRKDPQSGKFVFPSGIPAWAETICERLAHALGEYFHEATTSAGYRKSHDTGIAAQNKVRRDFGQADDVTDKSFQKHGDHGDGVSTVGKHKAKAHIKDSQIDTITYEE